MDNLLKMKSLDVLKSIFTQVINHEIKEDHLEPYAEKSTGFWREREKYLLDLAAAELYILEYGTGRDVPKDLIETAKQYLKGVEEKYHLSDEEIYDQCVYHDHMVREAIKGVEYDFNKHCEAINFYKNPPAFKEYEPSADVSKFTDTVDALSLGHFDGRHVSNFPKRNYGEFNVSEYDPDFNDKKTTGFVYTEDKEYAYCQAINEVVERTSYLHPEHFNLKYYQLLFTDPTRIELNSNLTHTPEEIAKKIGREAELLTNEEIAAFHKTHTDAPVYSELMNKEQAEKIILDTLKATMGSLEAKGASKRVLRVALEDISKNLQSGNERLV